MTTGSLLSPTPSPVVSAPRPPHHGGHGRHDGRRERGQDGTGQPVDASHAGLLLSRRRKICPYNVKSIAPAATEGSRAGRRAGQPALVSANGGLFATDVAGPGPELESIPGVPVPEAPPAAWSACARPPPVCPARLPARRRS